jgi:hypothetical protein
LVISKVANQYNNYKLEISYGELQAFYELTTKASGAMYDEMRANLEFYFKRLPEPGSDEASLKKPEHDPKASVEMDPEAVEDKGEAGVHSSGEDELPASGHESDEDEAAPSHTTDHDALRPVKGAKRPSSSEDEDGGEDDESLPDPAPGVKA